MDESELVSWLLEQGGPSVHFRTLVDLVGHQDVLKVSCALDDLINSPIVKMWLDRLSGGLSLKAIHSSRPDSYENTMGKLVQLGMRAGLQPFDNMTLRYRAWLTDNPPGEEEVFGPFKRIVLAALLSYAGYDETSTVKTIVTRRLGILHRSVMNGSLSEIYASEEDQKHVPGVHSPHRLIRAGLKGRLGLALPFVYDLLALGNAHQVLKDPVQRAKLEKVIDVVMSEEYQSLPPGYGVVQRGDRYYVVGWSVHLPKVSSENGARMLWMMELLAPFERARTSTWFREAWHRIEMQKTLRGTYRFPTRWVSDQASGYWVNGAYMALGGRRTDSVIEQESTFRVLWLKHLMTR
ncbi:hypothetical protein EU520_01015 [Candidatus Thorarchaeota archaeon]|nr:MAG: hypothetical protein EU520_01015 [Candidatus Thorarchaeota archaeon]